MHTSRFKFFSFFLTLGTIAFLLICSDPRLAATIQSGFPVITRSGNTSAYVNFTGSLTGTSSPCLDGSGNLTISGCAASGGGGGIVTYSGPALTFITGTQFFPIGGGGVSSTTETNVDVESPSAVTVTNFYVQLSAAVGAGNSVAFTWRKNAADTPLTCTISGASATTCNDTTHSATLAQADLVDIKAVGTGTIVASVTTVMATQFGTILSGQVNTGTAHQTALYSSAGSTISGGGPGTAGQVWTSNGAGADPTFQNATGGGSTISIGAIASLPVSVPAAGNTYETTDGFYRFVSDGTVWQPFIGSINAVKPPTLTAAGSGGGTSTLDTTHGGMILTMPAVAVGDSVKYAIHTAAQSAPYTITAAWYQPGIGSANNFAGVALRESATQKAVVFGNRALNALNLITVASDTSWAGGIAATMNTASTLMWVKLQNDGTNMKFFLCSNPWNCNHLTVFDVTVASRFTTAPDQTGIAVETEDATMDASMSLVYFSEVSGIH